MYKRVLFNKCETESKLNKPML